MQNLNQCRHGNVRSLTATDSTGQYGSMGCGVFKQGGAKLENLLPKNQHTQWKLLNFEFWIKAELSKRAKIRLLNTNLGAQFLLLTFLDKIFFFITLLLKSCPIFYRSPLIQNSIIFFRYVDYYAKICLIL